MSRLFVAAWLPGEFVERLRSMERPEIQGVRWTTEDQWHVTLRFLGEVADGDVDVLRDRLGSAAAACPPMPASAGPRPKALGSHVWVLPVEGLRALAESVTSATSGVVPVADARRYNGHITLARCRRGGSLKSLPTPDLEASWDVAEVTLVRSDLHPSGARYSIVGRWPLRGA